MTFAVQIVYSWCLCHQRRETKLFIDEVVAAVGLWPPVFFLVNSHPPTCFCMGFSAAGTRPLRGLPPRKPTVMELQTSRLNLPLTWLSVLLVSISCRVTTIMKTANNVKKSFLLLKNLRNPFRNNFEKLTYVRRYFLCLVEHRSTFFCFYEKVLPQIIMGIMTLQSELHCVGYLYHRSTANLIHTL